MLLLDEPTAGLGPNSRKTVRKVLRELAQQGKTIVLSSHELWEVEKLSTRLGIIDKGKLIGADTIEALREKLAPEVKISIRASVDKEVVEKINNMDQVVEVKKKATGVEVLCMLGLITCLTSWCGARRSTFWYH